MRYIVRSIKYFIQVSILMTAVIAVLMLAGIVSSDIDIAFRSGWKSVGYILLMFAVVAAVYPRFGYASRSVSLPGAFAELRDGVLETLRARGYDLETEEGENLTFRLASATGRAARLWEDRLTFTRELGGFRIEGPNKDLVRVVSALEYRFRSE